MCLSISIPFYLALIVETLYKLVECAPQMHICRVANFQGVEFNGWIFKRSQILFMLSIWELRHKADINLDILRTVKAKYDFILCMTHTNDKCEITVNIHLHMKIIFHKQCSNANCKFVAFDFQTVKKVQEDLKLTH